MNFVGTPGYKYRIYFSTDGIDKTKPSNKEYLESLDDRSLNDITFNINIELRECLAGEAFSDSG